MGVQQGAEDGSLLGVTARGNPEVQEGITGMGHSEAQNKLTEGNRRYSQEGETPEG